MSMDAVELAVKTVADVAIANEKYFSELDSAAGDADFGVSLATGFRAVISQWDAIDRSSIGLFLMKVGVIITSNVGGCSGPIWGTAFMRAGTMSKDKTSLMLTDLVTMLRAAIKGIMARGGAQLGDKTLLDALAPATDKLEEWSQKDTQDILGALQAATGIATETIESTRGWIAKRGRQAFTGERSIGTLDPGVVAVAIMLQAVTKALKDAYE
ncbi:MAG: dihydroxyacetone kinase subunit L [Chloroflexi bacterium]|nr:dihydroxyacetone kinase subunit L [Chloroflexota bacterium]